MPSFDIVSEVDIGSSQRGVENATREVESRFDFRGVEASFELNDANKTIKVLSESDFRVNQLLDILRAKLVSAASKGPPWTCRKSSSTAAKRGLLKRS